MNLKVRQGERIHKSKEIKNIKDMLEKSAELYKNNIAFKYKENGEIKTVTYEQVKKDVDALGTALINLGLKNKKIAIVGVNSYKWVVAYLATVCGTGIVVPIDKALPANEIENLINQSNAEAVFFDEKYTEYIKNMKVPSLKHSICFENASFDNLINTGKELLKNNAKSFINAEIDDKAMNIILFTSGTTSNSKGVMLSHSNICTNIMGLSEVLEYKQEDIILSFLPIHHTFESTVTMLSGLYNGCCMAFCEGLRYVVQNIKDFNISIFTTVPLVLENLYKKVQQQVVASEGKVTAEAILKSIAPNWRFALVGAAPLNKEVIIGFKSWGLDVHQGYGLTETSPILTLETDNLIKPGSIGVSLPNVEIEIDNPDENGLGEIKVKGPNVMLGYYENKEATDEVLKDGWFYTGDLGYVDEEGFLFISGRKKNVIVLKNGKNIFPEEIEVVLNDNPYVAESFVYAEEARDGDSKICAKIVYNKEAMDANLGNLFKEKILDIMQEHRKKVNKSLPLYKTIKQISITTEPLVKTTTGKIKRYANM